MPALPEFADGEALVGGVEVDRDADVEHEADAGRHVAVAGKIEVELERVADGDEPCLRRIERGGGAKARVDRGGEGIGDDDLLEQAQREGIEARREVVKIKAAVFGVGELRDDLAVQHDRPGDELREERHEQRVIENIVARHRAAVAVDDVGELLEGEKRDAQRQRDAVEREGEAERAVQVFAEEVVILEVEEHAEVGRQAQQHQRQAHGLARGGEHALAERIVDQDAQHDDGHIARVVVAVEDERGEHEEHLVRRDALRQAAQQKVDDQRHGQKGQHEDIGIEEHGAFSP